MATTQSGYTVISGYGDPRIKKLIVNGVSVAPGVRKGDTYTILEWVAKEFNDTVSRLKQGQCWGFAQRNIRGGSGWSNHAGAVAIDLNSSEFPQGTDRMSQAQIKACRAIVKAAGGVIRWGGSYTWPTKVDQMHFEIANNMSYSVALRNLASKIRRNEEETVNSQDKKDIAHEMVKELMGTKIKYESYYSGKAAEGTTTFRRMIELIYTHSTKADSPTIAARNNAKMIASIKNAIIWGVRNVNEHMSWAVLDRDGKHPKAPIHTHDLVKEISDTLKEKK